MLLKKIYLCTMNIKRKKNMVVGTLDLGYKREQEIMIFKVGRWAMRGILFFKSFFFTKSGLVSVIIKILQL